MQDTIQWLLDGPAWSEYLTRIELLEQPETQPEVAAARQAMLEDPMVNRLVSELKSWPGNPSAGVSNASHPLNKLVFLADLGITVNDPGIREIVEKVMAHQSPEGAFQLPSNGYGSRSNDKWAWKTCDFPSTLYALVKMGVKDPRVDKAVEALNRFSYVKGWPCVMSRDIQWFSTPGPYDDCCPVVNVIALKTLALLPEMQGSDAALDGADTLLDLWEHRSTQRPNMFGIGKRFQQLKAPFVWYNIVHMLDVLTMFPRISKDKRLMEMLDIAEGKADTNGRYMVESVSPGWLDWEFGQDSEPSRWLTLMILRMKKRTGRPIPA